MLGPFATTSRLTPIHQVSPLYCRSPPANRCPQQRRQQQRMTEGTAMAHGMGPIKRRTSGGIYSLWAGMPGGLNNYFCYEVDGSC